MSEPLHEIDLDNIEGAARRGFAHPTDTLLLVAEIRRLQTHIHELKEKLERQAKTT